MKKIIASLAFLSLIFATSCTEKKQGEVPNENDTVNAAAEVDNTATAAGNDSLIKEDTLTNNALPKKGDIITVTGKVIEINRGKDGYSARIYSASGQQYVGTISIPNMANPKDYRSVNIGETITVTGEAFPVEEDVMIKVTKLQ